MEPTPCDVHEYDSDEYNSCVKDIVYEQAQDEWIMLDPRFPNLKGITPKRIDEFLANAEEENMREYFEDYLQHVMVYDRDDMVSMCYDLGQQIEKKYPEKLHSPHSIFVTTPRGGHEVLSIFAYTNDLKKEQIPSHIRNISEKEQKRIKEAIKHDEPEFLFSIIGETRTEYIKEAYKHTQEGNLPIIPDIWLDTMSNYFRNKIETVFIIDDIIASGEQMLQALSNIQDFFSAKVEIIPIVLVDRKDDDIDAIYDTETVGIEKWDEARENMIKRYQMGYLEKNTIYSIKKEVEKIIKKSTTERILNFINIYDSLITVRFPWGSPDGESDKILTTLYESRRGLERIERKQRRCIIDPSKCELK